MPRLPDETDINFLSRVSGAKTYDSVSSADRTLFVYRDPLERVLSVFYNKFIIQVDAFDIRNRVSAFVGMDCDLLSFNSLIKEYLLVAKQKLDPHFHLQVDHLLPIIYTDAVPLDGLDEFCLANFGKTNYARFFKKKPNSTSRSFSEETNSADEPIRELRKRYIENSVLPSSSCLLDAGTVELITRFYARDYDLLRSLPPRNRTVPTL